jgi:dihydrofolate reductase
MRDVVVSEFMSLDGVVEDPGGAEGFEHGGWTFPYWNDEIGAFKLAEVLAADTLLLGRVTYEGFAAAWPGRTDEQGFAEKMNAMEKVVVSTTLEKPEWSNTRVVAADLAGELTRLKGEPGGDILVAGSRTLVQTLMQQDLVDRYQLLVYPIVLGSGKRLFPEGIHKPLELAETRSYGSGVVLVTYRGR